MSVQQEPQACTKCGYTPQDILMLSCTHDLCLNCASDRLGYEMLKKPTSDAISCEQCYEKTPLDTQSIKVLKQILKNSKLPNKQLQSQQLPLTQQNYGKHQENVKYGKDPLVNSQKGGEKYQYTNERTNFNNSSNSNTKSRSNIDVFQGISVKKNCPQHTEEELLYFCFDCKCECICPECVIHGKHKDHNVKTIRKSQVVVKQQVEKYIKQYENNIDKLVVKKSQFQKHMRLITEQNNIIKKQIQQIFDDFRKKINSKEKQLLEKCDLNLNDNLSQLDKCSKVIAKKIEELKGYTTNINEASRRQQILFLNFYSKKYTQMKQITKDPQIPTLEIQTISNDSVITSIKNVGEQVAAIQIGRKNQVHDFSE